MNETSFSQRLATSSSDLTPTERRVVNYLSRNREMALLASAADMARQIGTSDATIIRTARKLGFSGLEELRRGLAVDLRRDITLSERIQNDLSQTSGGVSGAVAQTVETLRATLDAMMTIPAEDLEQAMNVLTKAQRVRVFGIGPSGHLAGYFSAQLTRLGGDARPLRQTGLQMADDLIGLRVGDTILALAYDRPYQEFTALVDHAIALSIPVILITSPGPVLPDYRANIVLRVARGRTDGFGLHAGTLALLEAMLVAFATARPDLARTKLEALNTARKAISGDGMGL
ncbi:MAG: MurR/RpiR family transcriptional regulator [Rhodobacteraceae bacterium]|nr:MurR/RpiR family transcriptional regulator [Paracoccaceae bacterium]